MQVLVITAVLSVVLPWCAVHGTPEEEVEYTWGEHGDQRNPTDGTYSFYYEVPGHSTRAEERELSSEEDSNEVEGSYSFVSPEGEEFQFKYEAGVEGFIVESNALPKAPEDTDEVKQAKKEFFKAYCKALGEEDCDINEYDKIENVEEEESDEDSSEEDGEDSSEEEEDNKKGGWFRFKRKSIKDGSFNSRHNLDRSLGSRYTAAISDQKPITAVDKFQKEIERNALINKSHDVLLDIQRYIGNTSPSHSRIQHLEHTHSQNSFEKNKELLLNRNRVLVNDTASMPKSYHVKPAAISTYQQSHGTKNLNEKTHEHYSLQISHNQGKFLNRKNVSDTIFQKRQHLKSSLPIHNYQEIKIQETQGLESPFKKINSSKAVDLSLQIKKKPNTHTNLKSLIRNNQDNINLDDGMKNLYKKLDDIEKSILNTPINLKSSLTNRSIKSLNTKSDQKASLRSSPIVKDTNRRIQSIKDERSRYQRRRGYGLQHKRKGKSYGYFIEGPSSHHTYSVSYGEK